METHGKNIATTGKEEKIMQVASSISALYGVEGEEEYEQLLQQGIARYRSGWSGDEEGM